METYDLIDTDSLAAESTRLRDQVMLGWAIEKKKLEELDPDKNITFLDLGCGPGFFSELVGEAFPNWKVIGIDNNSDLLPKSSNLPNITFLLSTTKEVLPLEDASVDVVYCRFLFQHLTNKTETLSEILRVLRPNGIIIAIDVDDRGVIFSPEQEWISSIYKEANEAHKNLHADRHIGAAFPKIFTDNGFKIMEFNVIPMTNWSVPSRELLLLALGLKCRLLESNPKTASFKAELDKNILNFSRLPGHVIYIPIFFCMATKPVQIKE